MKWIQRLRLWRIQSWVCNFYRRWILSTALTRGSSRKLHEHIEKRLALGCGPRSHDVQMQTWGTLRTIVASSWARYPLHQPEQLFLI